MIEVFNEVMTKKRKNKNNDGIVASDTSSPWITALSNLTAATFADKYEKVEIIKNM